MNDFQKAKIEKFINDKEISNAVFDVILASFLKKRNNQDIYLLAASRLSVDYLKEAWEVLEKYQQEKEEKSAIQHNPGL